MEFKVRAAGQRVPRLVPAHIATGGKEGKSRFWNTKRKSVVNSPLSDMMSGAVNPGTRYDFAHPAGLGRYCPPRHRTHCILFH